MSEKLKEYILKKENEQKELFNKEKNDFLISLGLFEKEYSSKRGNGFDFEAYDSENCKVIYYKKVAIDVTDEEYSKLLELSKNTKVIKNSNKIADILTAIAWLIFIAGFIAGIALGNVETGIYYSRTEFSFAVALIYWAISFISGIFILSFAEIIKLLNDIKNKYVIKNH